MQSDFVLILHLSTVVNKAIVNKKLFALFKKKPVSFDYVTFPWEDYSCTLTYL